MASTRAGHGQVDRRLPWLLAVADLETPKMPITVIKSEDEYLRAVRPPPSLYLQHEPG